MNELTEEHFKKARVLVVEDDPVMSELIVSILNSIGIRAVSTAKDGVQAWRKFEDGEQFDLVICDWVMPGMDGLEVLKNIRAGLGAIPFILVTVRDSEAAVKNATDRGVTAFVAKPFAPQEFASQVVRVLTDSAILKADADSEVWEI